MDNLALLNNFCTGGKFLDYEFVVAPEPTEFPNDDALRVLLDGGADAMFVYADQAANFQCNGEEKPWDCELWEGFGTKFAYIHTGNFGWARNGTTLTISKKGSGLASLVNPCIAAFRETEAYFELCVKYELVDQCFVNDFFPHSGSAMVNTFDLQTNQLTTDCSSGYCSCPV